MLRIYCITGVSMHQDDGGSAGLRYADADTPKVYKILSINRS